MLMQRTLIGLILALICAAAVWLFSGQAQPVRIGLTILTLVAVLWVTETFHVSVTALLVPVLAVLTGVFEVREALTNFAHPVIFLFMGGFALATALHNQRIDERISATIVSLARGNVQLALWLTFVATAFVSMWISNTATTAMMLPLVLGMLSRFIYEQQRKVFWYALLGVAYSANIGGIGTLVGSPPNAIAAANTGIGFSDWLSFGIPAVCIMLPVVIMVLGWRYRPDLSAGFELDCDTQPFNLKQKMTIAVFVLTVSGWLFSKPLAEWLGIAKSFDSLVALLAIVLLFALRLIDWEGFQRSTNWGVLILFGGGLTLSALMLDTGTSRFLGQVIIDWLMHAPLLLFLLVLTLFVVMLTEVSSNTASSALLIPVFMPVAASLTMSTEMIAATIAVAASCAFMLPVATPPNALVFGTGKVPQVQMMRVGLVLNLLMALLITAAVWVLSQV